jgi:hypothetical protein
MYTWWDYGKEVPFPDSFCEQGGRCHLRDGVKAEDIRYANTSGTSLIKMYILSQYSQFNFFDPNRKVISDGPRPRPNEQENMCGYWTFVPHILQ